MPEKTKSNIIPPALPRGAKAAFTRVKKKIAGGGKLTAAEKSLVTAMEKHNKLTKPKPKSKPKTKPVQGEEGELETTKTLTAMAKRLGVSLRTLQRARHKPDCPQDLVVAHWIAWQRRTGTSGTNGLDDDTEALAKRKQKAETEKAEFAAEKLSLEIDQIHKNLIPRSEVLEYGQKLGAIIQAGLSSLGRDLASRLEGKTPEERQVEVKKAMADVTELMREEVKIVMSLGEE